MADKQITYRDGYLYQLAADYHGETGIIPPAAIDTTFIALDGAGNITIRAGYAWDGPSGPTIDTKNFMRGSLVHDALYQLMREGHLDHDACRDPADRLLQALCREDGMSAFRAWYVYQGVSRFGKPHADPSDIKPPITAP